MRQIRKGSLNKSVTLYIIDSTDGTPETGVVYDTAGIDLQYRREGAAAVAVTEVALAALTTAHTDGGFIEIGFGEYRFDLPDAAFATGATHVTILGTVTGMIVVPVEIQLVDFDPDDIVRMGLTAMPNAAADAAGGLPISDAGGLALDTKLANTNEITAARMGALTDWIDGGRLDLILDTRMAEASINTTAGAVDLVTANTDMRGTDGANTVIPPTVAQMNARTLLAADYFDPTVDVVANVTLVDTTATNADMRGTDGANTTTPPTAAANADAVWDEARSEHVTAGTYGVNTGDAAMRGTDSAATPADVNAQVLDVMNVDTFAEPGQGIPGATISIFAKINYLYKNWRNHKDQNDTTWQLYNNDGTTVDQKATVSDTSGTADKTEIVSGP